MIGRDFRYAARVLARSPGFAAVAVGTVGLAIAAGSAIFGVVDGVLLRPLPYREPQRLVRIWGTSRHGEVREGNVSEMDFLDFRSQSRSFEAMAAFNWTGNGLTLTGAGAPERLRVSSVTAEFFEVLGVEPELGRGFLAEEDRPGSDRVVVLSHGLWIRRFGGDPEIVGKDLRLSGTLRTVVGVMPRDFQHPEPVFGREPELWIPLAIDVAEDNRGAHYLRAVGRLREGVAIPPAQEELDAIMRRLETLHPETNAGYGVRLEPLRDAVVGDAREALLLWSGAVALLLVIACSNLAHLFLARASVRRNEIALRAALGAGRLRLSRQLVAESLLVSLTGGVLGIALARWGLGALSRWAAPLLPRASEIELDLRVVAFTFALSLAAGFLSGLVPAVEMSRAHLSGFLKGAAARSPSGGRSRSALVIAEVALAFVLVTAAGLLVKSLLRLESVDPGLRPERVVSMKISLPTEGYPEDHQVVSFYGELLDRVRSLPGIEAAGTVDYLPFDRGHSCDLVEVEGWVFPAGEDPCVEFRRVSEGYFAALGISIHEGRGFLPRDRESPVALADGMVARRFWPGESALGKRVVSHGVSREIVGVVSAVRLFGLGEEPPMTLYVPHAQEPVRWQTLAVRARGEPQTLVAAIRAEVRSLDPELAVFDVVTLEDLVGGSIARPRLRALLVAAFSIAALALAALGVYGLVSCSVAERVREIGIRMALGARRGQVLRRVALEALRLGGAGLLIGALVSLALMRLLSVFLFEVSATDPAVWAAVAAVLLIAALAAACVPARRAARIDPLEALRYE